MAERQEGRSTFVTSVTEKARSIIQQVPTYAQRLDYFARGLTQGYISAVVKPFIVVCESDCRRRTGLWLFSAPIAAASLTVITTRDPFLAGIAGFTVLTGEGFLLKLGEVVSAEFDRAARSYTD